MRNKLLVGADAQRMLQDALREAREILGTDNLSTHPDYVFVEPSGKKTIGVEEILPVVGKCGSGAVLSEVAVAVIDGFDLLTVPAQNKLLLTLEANAKVHVICIASSLNPILDTVKSRLEIVEYKRAALGDFAEFENPELVYQAFVGDLQLARARKGDLAVINGIWDDLHGNPENLLKTLHLLEEKDPDAVTGDRVLMRLCLQAMKYALADLSVSSARNDFGKALSCSDLVARLGSEEVLMRKTSYAKEDFFLAVMEVIEKLKGGACHGTV